MSASAVRIVLLAIAVLAAPLAGCLSPGGGDGPGIRSLSGVGPSAGGNVTIQGENGIEVRTDPENATVRVGVGDRLRAGHTVQACDGACNAIEVPPGTLVAEGILVTFGNITVNAVGPDRDSAIFFFDAGDFAGQWLRWVDSLSLFALSAPLFVNGNVTATHHVGTVSIATTPSGPIELRTAATEGIEATVFVRGSHRLANGTANITFPEAIQLLVSNAPSAFYTCIVTLTSPGPALYVSSKGPDHCTVRTADGSNAEPTFDFFYQATRRGTEDFRAVGPVSS
ncbi:MAG TPA: hypothetical protein VM681_02935 [Candidatus Thermoplasmatota archaeon]|nr:hypothetical protein [Candidatus Thermoplasmatota archaeon]